MSYKELLLGCGHARDKRIHPPGTENFRGWCDLTTLDINTKCDADLIVDLSTWPFRRYDAVKSTWIPYIGPESQYNEIHAYEVLEHIGMQGDVRTFMHQFRIFWTWLKPGGYLCATVPDYRSLWAWGDPSHTRIINAGTLVFLSRKEYEKQLGKTSMSDYRDLMRDMDFDIVRANVVGQTFEFILRAIKPQIRDDVKCDCVGAFGPNPDCGKCGGDGCITASVPGIKCDGDHGGPRCADPECWNQ